MALENVLGELALESSFARLVKFEPMPGQELRSDETASDRYHGSAPDGAATASPTWSIVRLYKDSAGAIVRVRLRTGVAWDDRASGWS